MPRKKTSSVTATPKSASTSKTLKRERTDEQTPPPETTTSTPATRASKRLRTTPQQKSSAKQATPKKSKYFEHSDDEDGGISSESDSQDSGSGYEDGAESEASDTSPEEEEDEEDNSASDSDAYGSKQKARKGRSKQKIKKSSNGKSKGDDNVLVGQTDLWREGVKTGLGPGKQVYIERPKARGDGGIKYVPERIHPNTFAFLKDLKKNNDRQWLKAHDADYRQSWKDFESFVETLTEKISEVDETIPELPPKDLVFRIYRDVRFSSDPTPYKPHFSAAWSRTGRKGPYACYYVHIQPGGRCFVGGGLWHPDAAPIALLRSDIDNRSERLREVLMEPALRKHIFGGISKDSKKAVKAFCDQNKENALKTKPKGYDADHPQIDLLRLRNFTIGQKISDEDMLSSRGLDRIIELIGVMYPFVTYLNSVVMPDEEENDNDNDNADADESEDDLSSDDDDGGGGVDVEDD